MDELNNKIGDVLDILWGRALDAKAMGEEPQFIDDAKAYDKAYLQYRKNAHNETIQQLQSIISEAVRLGRIDELNHVMNGDNGAYWASDRSDIPDTELSIQERIANLKEVSK